MPRFRLRLSLPAGASGASAGETFLWANDRRDSFLTGLGPSLGQLGPVPKSNIELVRLGVGVFAADRSTPRVVSGSNWSSRDFELTVPVFDSARWEPIRERLGELLGFLSGDSWTLRFVTSRSPKEPIHTLARPAERVVLLSGGADSAIGALVCSRELSTSSYTLVSHVGATNLAPIQRSVARSVEKLSAAVDQVHKPIRLVRSRRQVDGRNFPNEFTTRSRSLLFLSLGLAVASVDAVDLWIPENGFASLNPPLGADQRGSLSTRTTHPTFLSVLSGLLTEIGVHAPIVNPFERTTKGEMFRAAADLIGVPRAGSFLSSTHSCAHTGHRSFGLPVATHCGVCFGCLVRKSAFAASGIPDGTVYITAGTRADIRNYLAKKSMVRSVREFVVRGMEESDIATMALPESYPARAALDLIKRTSAELALIP